MLLELPHKPWEPRDQSAQLASGIFNLRGGSNESHNGGMAQTQTQAQLGVLVQVLGFEELELVRRLERLPDPLRVAFAAAAAQRLLPAYTNTHSVDQGHAEMLQ